MRITKPTPAHALLTIAALALSLALIPAALAKGKPGGGGTVSSTITGPVMVNDVNGDGLRNYGDAVTFDESTTATTQPYVNLLCYQNGVLVANGWNGFFDQALNPTRNFVLDSPSWQSGAADCTAWLDMYTKRGTAELASVSFHVDP